MHKQEAKILLILLQLKG